MGSLSLLMIWMFERVSLLWAELGEMGSLSLLMIGMLERVSLLWEKWDHYHY